MSAMGHQRPVATPAAVAPCPLRSKSGRSTHAAACPLFAGVSSGRRNTFSQTQETGGVGDWAEILSRVQRGGPRGGVGTLAGLPFAVQPSGSATQARDFGLRNPSPTRFNACVASAD